MIDIAANLTHRHFRADLAEVLLRSHSAGLRALIVTGLNVELSREAVKLTELSFRRSARRPKLFCTAGVHPHNANRFDYKGERVLAELSSHANVVAIGEMGLDYNRNFSTPAEQRRAFTAQLELAISSGKPVYLHERDAHEDFLAILKQYRPRLVGGVVHCFTSDERALHAYLDLDLHIGVTGWICDRRRGQRLYGLASQIPRERLMIETDAPFLLPQSVHPRPAKGRNEPAFLPYVLRTLAEARSEYPEDLARSSTDVAIRFFGLPLLDPEGS